MKILITGAGGFLGAYLKNYLHNYNVTALTSSELDLMDSTATTKHFSTNAYDVVVNCAAKGRYQARDVDHGITDANMRIFMNLLANQYQFGKLINIGTGAEFGLRTDINQAQESDIYQILPVESYGFSKNIISRLITSVDNFYTVRLFGCFDPKEPPGRLLSGFIQNYKTKDIVEVTNDRYVDYVSVADFAKAIELFIQGVIVDKDINIVYKEKYLMSELFIKYCNIHGLDSGKIVVTSTSPNNYTGNSEKIENYLEHFQGLDKALEEYKYE